MIERNLSERYRLDKVIGQGGMATVYSGLDTVLRRRVGIKVLRPQFAADAEFVKRFYDEAQHAAKLQHPNVVNIYDVGTDGERYFIVMELVDGTTLADMIEHDGRLPERVAIDFAAQLCNGLAYAHRQGLLHRDIKPANVLITRDDVVKLSDFGIARAISTQTVTSATQPGMVMGSVYYISPEQAQGRELAETSDLYSLGVVLFQMLTGKLPFTGDSPVTIALRHVTAPIPPLDIEDGVVSPALAAIVKRLLQKDPEARYGSAMEVAKALREARDDAQTGFDGAEPPQRGKRAFETTTFVRTIPNPKPRPSKFPDTRIANPGRDAAREHAQAHERERTPADETNDDGVAIDRDGRGGPNRTVAIALALVLLVVAIAGGYVLTNRPGGIFGEPAAIALESVVGETASDAEAALVKAGFSYTVTPVASDSVPKDRVISQTPGPSAKVAPHSSIELVVSTGLPSVAIPDVGNFSVEDATRLLKSERLTVKVVQQYDESSPKGSVLSQRPGAGVQVSVRSLVTLVVSQGAKPVSVPEVVSMTVDDATSALDQRHLKIVVQRTPIDGIAEGVIASQQPDAGSQVAPDSTVTVTVSSGPPGVSVPDVMGQDIVAATKAILDAGLKPSEQFAVQASTSAGTVIDEDPAGGSRAKKGDPITLQVAVPGIVPDVSGMTLDEAQLALQNAGYRGNVAYTQEGETGKVVRTEPVANTPLRPGESVTITVSGVEPQ
jgi:serine/threonine-protein kinase